MTKSQKHSGEMFIFLAAFCWSWSGVISTFLSVPPLLSNAIRNGIAFIMMFCYARFKIKINKTILLGGVCLAVTSALYFISLKMTDPANAVVMQYTAPVFVLIWTCIAGKKAPSPWQVAVLLLAFAGVVTVFSADLFGQKGHLVGNLLALLSGIAFSGEFFVNKMKNSSPVDSHLVGFLMGFLMGGFYLNQLPDITTVEWGWLVVLGVFQLGLAHIFFCKGIGYCSGFGASLISISEVVMAVTLMAIFTKKVPSLAELAGGVMIVAAVVLNVWLEKKQTQKKTLPENQNL